MWVHLLLWWGEFIPAWSHRPTYKLQSQPFSFFFFLLLCRLSFPPVFISDMFLFCTSSPVDYIFQSLLIYVIKFWLCNLTLYTFFLFVSSAGRGTRCHTPAVRGVAGSRRSRRPVRLPALRQLSEGEEERRRGANGALQVTRGSSLNLVSARLLWNELTILFVCLFVYFCNSNFSAGIGRTGVLITMETALNLMDQGRPVFPLDIVKTLREQRAMMVQTTVLKNKKKRSFLSSPR